MGCKEGLGNDWSSLCEALEEIVVPKPKVTSDVDQFIFHFLKRLFLGTQGDIYVCLQNNFSIYMNIKL